MVVQIFSRNTVERQSLKGKLGWKAERLEFCGNERRCAKAFRGTRPSWFFSPAKLRASAQYAISVWRKRARSRNAVGHVNTLRASHGFLIACFTRFLRNRLFRESRPGWWRFPGRPFRAFWEKLRLLSRLAQTFTTFRNVGTFASSFLSGYQLARWFSEFYAECNRAFYFIVWSLLAKVKFISQVAPSLHFYIVINNVASNVAGWFLRRESNRFMYYIYYVWYMVWLTLIYYNI